MGKKLSEVSYILYLFLSLNSFLINILIWKYNYNNTCFFQDGACFKECIDYYGNDVVATNARDAAGKFILNSMLINHSIDQNIGMTNSMY